MTDQTHLLQFLSDQAAELLMKASKVGPVEAQPLKAEAEELCFLRERIASRLAEAANTNQMELPLSEAA